MTLHIATRSPWHLNVGLVPPKSLCHSRAAECPRSDWNVFPPGSPRNGFVFSSCGSAARKRAQTLGIVAGCGLALFCRQEMGSFGTNATRLPVSLFAGESLIRRPQPTGSKIVLNSLSFVTRRNQICRVTAQTRAEFSHLPNRLTAAALISENQRPLAAPLP